MVPEGWGISSVGDCSSTVMGFAFSSGDFVDKGVPLIRMGNLYQNQLDLNRRPAFLPTEYLEEYNRFEVGAGDLVMSMTGTLGKRDYGFAVVIPKATKSCLLNQRVMKFIPKNNTDASFLLYLLRSERFLNKLYSFPGGTKQANLSANQVKDIEFSCPPLPEQRKIAEILSTWDRAIEVSEALLTTARTQKRSLMQSLLTGKRRFPEFEGQAWKEVRLGDLVQISKDRHNPKNGGESRRCIELEHLEAETGRHIGWTGSEQQASVKAVFRAGDVLFGKLRPYLRKFLAPNFDGVCSTEIWVLQPKSQAMTTGYLHCLIQSDGFMIEAEKSAGSKMPRADWKVVSEYWFKLPEPSEQQRIAAVFSGCDQEITSIALNIQHLRTEKRALMQQLLTGKRRVVV